MRLLAAACCPKDLGGTHDFSQNVFDTASMEATEIAGECLESLRTGHSRIRTANSWYEHIGSKDRLNVSQHLRTADGHSGSQHLPVMA